MGFVDCCSALLNNLPNPALPILPSLILGTSFASLILLYLYQKETNLPFTHILVHAARNLFLSVPVSGSEGSYSHHHSQHLNHSGRCSSVECVRCERHEVLRRQIKARWRTWSSGKVNLVPLRRVEEAIHRMESKGDICDYEKDDQREMEGDIKHRGTGKKKNIITQNKEEEILNSSEDKGSKNDNEEKNNSVQREMEGGIKHRGTGKKKKDLTTKSKGEENPKSPENKDDSGDKEEARQEKKLQNPTIFRMDLAANPDWSESQVHINDQTLLQLNFELIQKEFTSVFEALRSGNASGWKNNNIGQGHWCIFPLINQGKIIASNCRRCPGVAELVLGCLPAMMNDCVFGNAAFSILYPNSHITTHCGPSNLRLRCHLGLKVPPGCWLEVAGRQHRWTVGKTLLFDDSFTHSAYFGSRPSAADSEPRAVLLLDFWHPGVTQEEKVCLLDLLAPLD